MRRHKHARAAVGVALVMAAGALCGAAEVQARVTRIVIDPVLSQSPTFGGYSWPGVGRYEKIVGKAYGEVDPNDPKNAVIVDLALAPRNAAGKVEYAFDFYILKPIDLSKGAHKVLYEPPNRGRKTWAALARVAVDAGANGNDPGSAITDPTVLANSFLMPRGYTIVWSGWDKSAGSSNANFNMTATLPIAKNPGGSTITGPSYEYIVSPGATYTLSYPAAAVDNGVLTHRVHLDDPPVVVPASGWEYTSASKTAIRLLPAGTPFIANDIYEFKYSAKDPTVNAWALLPCVTGTPGCATRPRTTSARPTRWPGTSPASTPRCPRSPGAC